MRGWCGRCMRFVHIFAPKYSRICMNSDRAVDSSIKNSDQVRSVYYTVEPPHPPTYINAKGNTSVQMYIAISVERTLCVCVWGVETRGHSTTAGNTTHVSLLSKCNLRIYIYICICICIYIYIAFVRSMLFCLYVDRKWFVVRIVLVVVVVVAVFYALCKAGFFVGYILIFMYFEYRLMMAGVHPKCTQPLTCERG